MSAAISVLKLVIEQRGGVLDLQCARVSAGVTGVAVSFTLNQYVCATKLVRQIARQVSPGGLLHPGNEC